MAHNHFDPDFSFCDQIFNSTEVSLNFWEITCYSSFFLFLNHCLHFWVSERFLAISWRFLAITHRSSFEKSQSVGSGISAMKRRSVVVIRSIECIGAVVVKVFLVLCLRLWWALFCGKVIFFGINTRKNNSKAIGLTRINLTSFSDDMDKLINVPFGQVDFFRQQED